MICNRFHGAVDSSDACKPSDPGSNPMKQCYIMKLLLLVKFVPLFFLKSFEKQTA